MLIVPTEKTPARGSFLGGVILWVAGLIALAGQAGCSHPRAFAYRSVFTRPPMPLPRYQQLDCAVDG